MAQFQVRAWRVRQLLGEKVAQKVVHCPSRASLEAALQMLQWGALAASEDQFQQGRLGPRVQLVQLDCLLGPLLEVMRRGLVLLLAWVHDQILVAMLLPVGFRTAWAGRSHGGHPFDVQDGQLNVGTLKSGEAPRFSHQGPQHGNQGCGSARWKELARWMACAPSLGLEETPCPLKARSDKQECRCQSNGRTACHRAALCKSRS